MDKVLKVILIGAGNRGETYTDIMAAVKLFETRFIS